MCAVPCVAATVTQDQDFGKLKRVRDPAPEDWPSHEQQAGALPFCGQFESDTLYERLWFSAPVSFCDRLDSHPSRASCLRPSFPRPVLEAFGDCCTPPKTRKLKTASPSARAPNFRAIPVSRLRIGEFLNAEISAPNIRRAPTSPSTRDSRAQRRSGTVIAHLPSPSSRARASHDEHHARNQGVYPTWGNSSQRATSRHISSPKKLPFLDFRTGSNPFCSTTFPL